MIIHWAAVYNAVVILQALVSTKGANLRILDNDGQTTLKWAVKHGTVDTITILQCSEPEACL